MADHFGQFIKVLESFNEHDVDYVLIGGVAVILHGIERFTRDVDIFVKMVPENIERLRVALYAVFHDKSIEEITLNELNKYRVIRYGTPDDFYIDIIARLGEAAAFEDLKFEIIEHHGVKVRVATPETLYQLKKDTLRDRDKMDIALLQVIIKDRKAGKSRRK